jgi:hypothetical protein
MVVVLSDVRGKSYILLRCVLCGSPVNVRWHHLSYIRGFVLPVCTLCHSKIHSSNSPLFKAFAPVDRKENDRAAFRRREKDITSVLSTVKLRLNLLGLHLAPPESWLHGCLILHVLAKELEENLERFARFAKWLKNFEHSPEIISRVASLLRQYADELERETRQAPGAPRLKCNWRGIEPHRQG